VADIAPEFCRVVPLARLGSAPFRQQIEATTSEREKLSRRFDLLTLDRLTATVELRRQGDDIIVLEAELREVGSRQAEAAFEPLNRDLIDIGEAVAQELSLSLPVFPRHPDAKIEAETLVEPSRSPFGSLARLKQRREC